MSDKQERRNWTREETTLALALYLRTPTSQITVTNPNVLMLAKAINRSAASVKMKLFNLASHDVRLRDKHLDSLKHGNRMDEEVWNDYMGQDQTKSLDPLFNDLDNIARYFELNLPFVCRTDIDAPTETIAQIKLRRNQGFFHDTILSMYQNRCLVTGLSLSPLIEVAHIVPWSEDAPLRLVPANGLTLNLLVHRAYDANYLGIDPDMNIHVCQELMDKSEGKLLELFKQVNGSRLVLPKNVQPAPEYLELHYVGYLNHEHKGEFPLIGLHI